MGLMGRAQPHNVPKMAEQSNLPKVSVDFDGEPFGMDSFSIWSMEVM